MIYYYVFNKLFYLILFFFYNNSGIKLKIFLIEAKISCHFFRKKIKKNLLIKVTRIIIGFVSNNCIFYFWVISSVKITRQVRR